MWDCNEGAQSLLFIYFCFNYQLVIAQLLGLTGNNASNNQTLTECLTDLIPSWGGEMSQLIVMLGFGAVWFRGPFFQTVHRTMGLV